MSTYIIAEIGINHNGSLESCFKLVAAAAKAGCDAVKIQTFKASRLYPSSAGKLCWKNSKENYEYDIYEAVKEFEIPFDWIPELVDYCKEHRINFISSVCDTVSLDLVIKAGLKAIKLPSYTITHIPLIQACAQSGLPIIMSTGGATLAETEEAVDTVFGFQHQLKLLHCSIQYPTAFMQAEDD